MSKVIKTVPREITVAFQHKVVCSNCDNGYVTEEKFEEEYKECMALVDTQCSCGGTYSHFVDEYIKAEPQYTVVECDCGNHLNCSGFTTTCSCGKDYDWNGTQLAPREQWGYETGETF